MLLSQQELSRKSEFRKLSVFWFLSLGNLFLSQQELSQNSEFRKLWDF